MACKIPSRWEEHGRGGALDKSWRWQETRKGDGLKMTVGSVDQIQDYNNPTNTHRSCLPSSGMLH